ILPYLFSRGAQGRSTGYGMYDSALNRDQRGRQFRRQIAENRRAQDRQIEAQKEAEDRAFTRQLGMMGVQTAASAGAGAIAGSAMAPATQVASDATARTISGATTPIVANAPVSAGPDFMPDLPPVDYSPMSTNIPAANTNPGMTGIDKTMATRPTAAPTPVNVSRVPSGGQINPTMDARIPDYARSAPYTPPSRGSAAARGAALGALGALSGQNYVAPYLNFISGIPAKNAEYGLELARTGSRIGVDAANIAAANANARASDASAYDRYQSGRQREALTQPKVAVQNSIVGANDARAGASNAAARLSDTRSGRIDTLLPYETENFDARTGAANALRDRRVMQNANDAAMQPLRLEKLGYDTSISRDSAGRSAPMTDDETAGSVAQLESSL
ncbi:MAG TPA: hypothetical protein P5081_24925, partial [Phycisphaerae bacterium]|nr:hypothetical protein [Phycisphaerae bacterium]